MMIYLSKMPIFHMKMPKIGVHLLLPSCIGGDKNPRWDDPPFATWIGGLGIQGIAVLRNRKAHLRSCM